MLRQSVEVEGSGYRRSRTDPVYRAPVEPITPDWPSDIGQLRDSDRTLSRYPVRHLLRHFEEVS